jgi:hypothetical protein
MSESEKDELDVAFCCAEFMQAEQSSTNLRFGRLEGVL